MRELGFPHLQPTLQKLVRQHINWTSLLSEEIRKAEKLMHKENLTHHRRDNRRDIRRKNEIFKNSIKEIKKITGKYNTSKPLTEEMLTTTSPHLGTQAAERLALYTCPDSLWSQPG